MISNPSLFKLLHRLWGHLSYHRRRQFLGLLALTILASFAEIFSISAVLPFIAVLTNPEQLYENESAQFFIQHFHISDAKQLLLPFTLLFGVATLLAGLMRLLLLWATTRLSFSIGAELGNNVYRRTLFQPYSVHCARNSSEIISGISGKINSIINGTIFPFFLLISASVMLTAILIALFSVEPIIALLAFGGFGIIYIAIIKLTRKRLLSDSELISRESVQVIKTLQEGLGGIRDVLIDGSQDTYCNIYREADLRLRRAQGRSTFVANSPRYAMEALGMILIAALAYGLAQKPEGIAHALPILGALALGAQRLLPVLQQAYGSWAGMRSGQVVLQDTLTLLDQPLPEHANQAVLTSMPFTESIRLNQLSFRYSPEAPYVLQKLNLTIPKGSKIGFIGTTGSGKSTLLDIIMGLLFPTEGMLEVDGQPIQPSNYRAWQLHVAHVPQAIFLSDSSIEENIAFGIPVDQIDKNRVRQAAKRAQIANLIESWPQKYQTYVGERGIRLSGGQRQRIGIARAFYKQADVIIFDEATSALDNETEQAVMQAIEELSSELTILIIAHRVTTLKNCTQIVEMGEGGIRRIGSYQEIVG
jgi:ATP-binding cassette, subfamily B, bacterial PglK